MNCIFWLAAYLAMLAGVWSFTEGVMILSIIFDINLLLLEVILVTLFIKAVIHLFAGLGFFLVGVAFIAVLNFVAEKERVNST